MDKEKLNDIICQSSSDYRILNDAYDYIENLERQCKKQKEVIDKAINNSQYWIDYYTRLNSDERIVLRLQENIDILKEVAE